MNESARAAVTVADEKILAGHILPAIRAIRTHLGCSLQEAVLAFHDRHEALRRERPGAFTGPPGAPVERDRSGGAG
ncbi:hypothetical protein ACFV2B_24335 [Streptomyces lavendulae]|uniref:hypothetical protein n=1 Tax=Streptomyces lavendulae TaxID=1914 RepID=UPI0036ACFFB2